MGTVTFVDETTSGDRGTAFGIEVAEERLTVRELIGRRVREEVAEFNARSAPRVFQGLVQPEETERVLNGYALRRPRTVDAEAQTRKALTAFAGNGFLVLAGDRQLTELDEQVELTDGAEVTFLKLVPLVGG
jgi:predicted lipid-binding transport protein (Tim44 family)